MDARTFRCRLHPSQKVELRVTEPLPVGTVVVVNIDPAARDRLEFQLPRGVVAIPKLEESENV